MAHEIGKMQIAVKQASQIRNMRDEQKGERVKEVIKQILHLNDYYGDYDWKS